MNQNNRQAERARGRPLDKHQQDLKTQILDTAEELFAENGYAAVSIRRIADASGVNPALVHYYFGQKKILLQNVLERAVEPLALAFADMKNGPGASPELLADLLISMAARHPNVPRLLIREVILPGGEMRQHFTDNMAPQLGGALPGLLGKEKAAGRLQADLDPPVASMLLMAVCMFPFIARTLAEPVLGVRYDPAGIEFLKQQVKNLLNHGMKK
jgi:AcrR family transcriptional regulator